MPALKARIGGAWVNVGGADEVFVGATAPTDPNAELWYDTGAVTVGAGLAGSGLASLRPAAPSTPGFQYFATDTKQLSLWDGAAWQLIFAGLPRYKTMSVGVNAVNIPNSSTLLGTLDFGTSAFVRTIEVSGAILGTATTAAATPRMAININGGLRKQLQAAVPLNVTASVEITYVGEVAAGPCVVTLYCQNFAAGTFNVPADTSFSGLLANTRWDS